MKIVHTHTSTRKSNSYRTNKYLPLTLEKKRDKICRNPALITTPYGHSQDQPSAAATHTFSQGTWTALLCEMLLDGQFLCSPRQMDTLSPSKSYVDLKNVMHSHDSNPKSYKRIPSEKSSSHLSVATQPTLPTEDPVSPVPLSLPRDI